MELHLHDHRTGGRLASPDVYLINSYKDGHYQAFAAKDGKTLWGAGHGRTTQMPPWDEMYKFGKMAYPILVDGKILDRDGTLFDPLTGKRTGEKLAYFLPGLRFLLRLDTWRPWHVRHRL